MRYTVSKIAQLACNVTEQNMYQAVTLQFNRIIARNSNLLRSRLGHVYTHEKQTKHVLSRTQSEIPATVLHVLEKIKFLKL